MNHVLRSNAPISDGRWELLDREARERLAPALAARKLVIGYESHDGEVVRLYL